MVEVVRVTDDTSREFLADLIRETNRLAKRQQRIVGSERFPSKWDDAHFDLDVLLDDWVEAQA